MKFTKLLTMAAGLILLCTACSTTQDAAEAYSGESSEQIFKRGEQELRQHNYREAIKRFEALDVQYPFGRNTQLAELHIIYAYYMTGDYASAEVAADQFIRSYPADPHVDYAYYLKGLSDYNQNLGIFEQFFSVDLAQRDLTQIKKTYTDFATLINLYPASPYAPAAAQYKIYLRNVLANYELEVAQYYYSHQAYIAAANRASLVVRHYEGAPVVPKALVLMAKCYKTLGLKKNEQEVLQVLSDNYTLFIKT